MPKRRVLPLGKKVKSFYSIGKRHKNFYPFWNNNILIFYWLLKHYILIIVKYICLIHGVFQIYVHICTYLNTNWHDSIPGRSQYCELLNSYLYTQIWRIWCLQQETMSIKEASWVRKIFLKTRIFQRWSSKKRLVSAWVF